MKLRDKIIELLGGVPKAKYDLMRTMRECEAGRKNGLLRQLGQSVEIVSGITVRPEDASRMSNKELQEYVECHLARGLVDELKKRMEVVESGRPDGAVIYKAVITVFEKE